MKEAKKGDVFGDEEWYEEAVTSEIVKILNDESQGFYMFDIIKKIVEVEIEMYKLNQK